MAMRERQKALVRLFWKRLGLLALVFVVVAMLAAVWSVYLKKQESGALRAQAAAQLEELRQQEDTLSTYIAQLKTDRGKEAALREQYAVGRHGEELIVIVEPEKSEPVQASSTIRQWVRKFLPFW